MNIKLQNFSTRVAFNEWTIFQAVVDGRIYDIQLVKFDEPSRYGIDNGRISKLYIASEGRELANFDRGWDKRPTSAAAKAICAAAIQKFN